jgi:hypothetical protein
LEFSDNEGGLDFSDFDEDDDSDDSDDSDDEDDSVIRDPFLAEDYYEREYSDSEDGLQFPINRLAYGLNDDEQMFDVEIRGGILWDDEADDDESGSDDEDEDEDEDDGEVDSFIDQRSETEILGEGEDFDDTDLSIPYHTRENNYYTQVDSATEHPDSDNADDEEEQHLPYPARRSRRLQRSRIDTDDESEESSETVREAGSDEPSSSSQRGPATRCRGRPAIYLSDED